MLRVLIVSGVLAISTFSAAQSQTATKQESARAAFDLVQLASRLRNLGAGDRSVVVHSASKPGAVMMTSPGSPNDLLWSEMETVGWTKRVASPYGNAGEGNPLAKFPTFALTEEGAKAVRAVAPGLP